MSAGFSAAFELFVTEAESDIPVFTFANAKLANIHSHASSATPMDKMAIAEEGKELTWEVKTGETNELSSSSTMSVLLPFL